MKAYTDISQSKILAEFLPIDTADCCYIMYCTSDNPEWRYEGQSPMFLGDIPITEITAEHIPCWSLAALLDVLPTLDGRNANFCKDMHNNQWHVCYHSTATLSMEDTERYDNLIDACYEMILMLHKEELL